MQNSLCEHILNLPGRPAKNRIADEKNRYDKEFWLSESHKIDKRMLSGLGMVYRQNKGDDSENSGDANLITVPPIVMLTI